MAGPAAWTARQSRMSRSAARSGGRGTRARAARAQLPAVRCATGADPEEVGGAIPPLGTPCLRDRVVQTAAMLVLSPISNWTCNRSSMPAEPDIALWRRSNACIGRSWMGACRIFCRDSARGTAAIDGATRERRAPAGEGQAVAGNGRGGGRRARRPAPHEPGVQGYPARRTDLTLAQQHLRAPLYSGWKPLGHTLCFGAEIANYADNFVVCGQALAVAMRVGVERMMERLRLPVNARKTRCLRVPEEPLGFLGYRVGRNRNPRAGAAYIGTRPSPGSIRSVCR